MIKFGTGGWRSIIGDEFVKSNILLVGQGLANIMKKENKNEIVIGFDKRFLSDKASMWLAEVFAGNGIKVHYIDKVAPTPLIMYSVKSLGCAYGMAVTASHNPADYNGIKVFTEGGKDADLTFTQHIEKEIEALTLEDVVSVDFQENLGTSIIKSNLFNDYIDSIIQFIDVKSIRDKDLKILVDPMYGVSKAALQTVLMTARCEVDVINDKHDTQFGGRMPSPSESTLNKLKNMVSEKGYDLGIGTDGDADRLGIIDEEGHYISPNQIMCLLYYYLLKYKSWQGPVVRNIATTHMLDKIAADFNETCYEVPVGFKHISQKMHEKDAIIGGESSGGLTIKGHVKGKDGIFAAALLVEMISVTNMSIGEMIQSLEEKYGTHHFKEANLSFAKEKKSDLMKTLFEDKFVPTFEYEIERVSYMDGMKVYFKNGGWVIARFSGTEPLLRIFAEMPTQSSVSDVIGIFVSALEL